MRLGAIAHYLTSRQEAAAISQYHEMDPQHHDQDTLGEYALVTCVYLQVYVTLAVTATIIFFILLIIIAVKKHNYICIIQKWLKKHIGCFIILYIFSSFFFFT